jgi:hypothetical protein
MKTEESIGDEKVEHLHQRGTEKWDNFKHRKYSTYGYYTNFSVRDIINDA